MRVTFGPFEFDRASGELRKFNSRLRLTGHSLQILEMLLERPNQIVSREEMQQRLWKGTTFVDFNHGLNAAVNKLRQTLGDSADQPRYLETVPGKGYRFVAPIVHEGPAPLPEVAPEELPRSNRKRLVLAATLLGLTLASVAGFSFHARRSRTPKEATDSVVSRPVRYEIAVPENLELASNQMFFVSPDGRNLVYIAKPKDGGPLGLYVQALDELKPKLLPVPRLTETVVFWSPDSKYMALQTDGTLRTVDLAGNRVQEVGQYPGMLGSAWNQDGVIIFGTEANAIRRIGLAGGESVPVTVRDPLTERVHIFPSFLPDGRHFLYSRMSSNNEKTGLYIGSLDVKPEEQNLTPLLQTPFAAHFAESPDGNGVILFQRDTTLWAQSFDTSQLRLTGEPKVVAERVGNTRALGFSAASSGVLIHRNSVPHVAQLTWVDRHGQHLGTLGKPADHYDVPPRFSPDGTRIALTRAGWENTDIWVHDLSRDVSQRVTFEPAIDQEPFWSPDGKKLIFSSSHGGRFDLYRVGSNADGARELLYSSPENKYGSSLSADGRFLLYSTEKRDGIWVLPVEGSGKHMPVSFLRSPANERSGVFSPDSRWIAYVSNESGQPEVYVQPFSFPLPASAAGPKVLISRGGGTRPQWRGDGKEIFYRAQDGTLTAVPIATGPGLQPGAGKPLFRCGPLWTATADGNRFLVAIPVDQGTPPFTVVLNWQSGLKN